MAVVKKVKKVKHDEQANGVTTSELGQNLSAAQNTFPLEDLIRKAGTLTKNEAWMNSRLALLPVIYNLSAREVVVGEMFGWLECIAKSVASDPNYATAYLFAGHVHSLVGNYAEAIEAYKKATTLGIDARYRTFKSECEKYEKPGDLLANVVTTIAKFYYKDEIISDVIKMYDANINDVFNVSLREADLAGRESELQKNADIARQSVDDLIKKETYLNEKEKQLLEKATALVQRKEGLDDREKQLQYEFETLESLITSNSKREPSCPRCGTKHTPGALMCLNCHVKFGPADSTPQRPKGITVQDLVNKTCELEVKLADAIRARDDAQRASKYIIVPGEYKYATEDFLLRLSKSPNSNNIFKIANIITTIYDGDVPHFIPTLCVRVDYWKPVPSESIWLGLMPDLMPDTSKLFAIAELAKAKQICTSPQSPPAYEGELECEEILPGEEEPVPPREVAPPPPPTLEAEEAFECPSCGSDLSASDAKCPKCGTEFEEDTERLMEASLAPPAPPPEPRAMFECPKCGCNVDPMGNKCPYCGVEFEE